jgi:hypothetical protein
MAPIERVLGGKILSIVYPRGCETQKDYGKDPLVITMIYHQRSPSKLYEGGFTITHKETVEDETNDGEKRHEEVSQGSQSLGCWGGSESQTVWVIYIFKVT